MFSATNPATGGTNFKNLFTFSDISPKTQSYLARVYGMLFACAMICAFGMFVNNFWMPDGIIMTIASIALSIYLIYFIHNPHNDENMRMCALGALAFQLGFNIGPAIH